MPKRTGETTLTETDMREQAVENRILLAHVAGFARSLRMMCAKDERGGRRARQYAARRTATAGRGGAQ